MTRWIPAIWRARVDVAPAYERAVFFSIVQQSALAVLATLVLDMGETARGLAAIIVNC